MQGVALCCYISAILAVAADCSARAAAGRCSSSFSCVLAESCFDVDIVDDQDFAAPRAQNAFGWLCCFMLAFESQQILLTDHTMS